MLQRSTLLAAFVLLILAQATPVAPNQIDPVTFSWNEINTVLNFPGGLREQPAASVDADTSMIYLVGGYNSLTGTPGVLNSVYTDLWCLNLNAVGGAPAWTELTPLVSGAGVDAFALFASAAILKSRWYSVFGRTDPYFAIDASYGSTYADPTWLNILDLRHPSAGVHASRLPITLAPPAPQAAAAGLGVMTMSPRWLAGSVLVGNLMYVLGGVGGQPPVVGGAGYGSFGDSFVVINLLTGVAKVLATAGGPTDPAIAPNGNLYPVVFASRGGARIHAWGGSDYTVSNVLDPTLVYTYTVASDKWSQTFVQTRMGLGYANYVAQGDGVLVVGGDNQPIESGAGIGDVNVAFVIDASQDTPFTYVVPSAAVARESAVAVVLPNGTGVTFLGSTYSNLGATLANGYFPHSQTFVAFAVSGATTLAPAAGLAVSILCFILLQ